MVAALRNHMGSPARAKATSEACVAASGGPCPHPASRSRTGPQTNPHRRSRRLKAGAKCQSHQGQLALHNVQSPRRKARGVVMAGIARSSRLNGVPVKAPAVLLSGGETTVTIGKGRAGCGGRNTEIPARLSHRYGRRARCSDGIERRRRSIRAPDTLARARAANLDPGACRA